MPDTPPTKPGTPEPRPGMSGRQTYNVVADTVGGVNVRWKDNLFQGVAIFIFVLIGAGVGAFMAEERLMGAVVGATGGLIVGFFASGIFLMIFRAVRHIRGKHD